MFPISKDHLLCRFLFQSTFYFMFSIYVFCFQSHNDVSNPILMFPIYIVSKTYSKSSYYRFQSTLFSMYVSNQHIALDSLFPIYECCFQSKFIVSKLLFCFLSHNHVYVLPKQIFLKCENGFWTIPVCIFIIVKSER